MYGYDITDFETKFSNYSGCKCGGTCKSCSSSNPSMLNYCGCHNYDGDPLPDEAPEVVNVSSEGRPVSPTVSSYPEKTMLLGVDKRVVKLAAFAGIIFLGYKYILKPRLK